MTISSASGSGGGTSITGQLDIQYIVEQTIYAKKQPIRDLEPYQNLYKARKESFQEINTMLSELETSLYNIKTKGFSGKDINISDESFLVASAADNSSTGRYSIYIEQLAASQTSVSNESFSSADSVELTSGTFSITQAGKTFEVDFDNEAMSLNNLKNKINSSDLDVTATVINYGTQDNPQYKLQVFSDEEGTKNSFETAGTTSQISMGIGTEAQDARLYVNDTKNVIVRSSNTIDDIINGVKLELKDADVNKKINLEITNNTGNIKENVQSFVENYNKAIDYLNAQFQYNEATESAGVLSGDSTARKIQNELLKFASTKIEGAPDNYPSYKNFAQIGLKMDNAGKLSIDEQKLDNAIKNDSDGVKALFVDKGYADDASLFFAGNTNNTRPGSYNVNITNSAKKAILLAQNNISMNLLQDENLTINFNGKEHNISLETGLNKTEVLQRLTQYFNDNSVSLSAFIRNDKLSIESNEYGSKNTIKIHSDVATGGTGIGTTEITAQGEDVAGTIGGEVAEGLGRILKAINGDAQGLSIMVDSSTTGDKGNFQYMKGPGEGLREAVYQHTFPYKGLIANSINALDDQLEGIDEQIADINRYLMFEEERLITEFTKANQALAQMDQIIGSLNQK